MIDKSIEIIVILLQLEFANYWHVLKHNTLVNIVY